MSTPQDYIDQTQWEIHKARRRAIIFTCGRHTAFAIFLFLCLTWVASLIVVPVLSASPTASHVPLIHNLRVLLVQYPLITYILFKLSPASYPQSGTLAASLWMLRWFFFVAAFLILADSLRKRAAQLRANAQQAETELPFQTALLRTLDTRTGDINADSVHFFQTTHNVLHRGDSKPWWLTFVLAVAASVTAYILTHLPH